MGRPAKPTRGGARPGAGRPRTTGRGAGRPITLRVSDDENAALTAAAGGDPKAVGRYLRSAGLALPLVVAALESGGDTLTGDEACALALAELRKVLPRRGG